MPVETVNSDAPVQVSAVAHRRREQILDAAVEIIATRGIDKLSLRNIEKLAGMARGQLTYYFPTKEDILLAVFDRMLNQMIAGIQAEVARVGGPVPGTGKAWDCLQHALVKELDPRRPPDDAFRSLLHTFHAQTSYREDFRKKLAAANAGWRNMIAADIVNASPATAGDPRTKASIIMGLLMGLNNQLAVDPDAFDRLDMMKTLLQMLAPLYRTGPLEIP